MATESKTNETTETEGKAKAGKRAVRLAKATNVAFSLEPKVRARLVALAQEEGLELGHYLQKVLENHILENSADGDGLSERLRAKRAVIDKVVEIALDLDAKGKFDEHFILTVMKASAADAEFMSLYNVAMGGEGKAAARVQKPLNQQLGRLIRKAVGGKGIKTDKGTVARAQVTGEIISSYTLLTKKG